MNVYRTDLSCALSALRFAQTALRDASAGAEYGEIADALSNEMANLGSETSWTGDEMIAQHATIVDLLVHRREKIADALEQSRQAWDELDRIISSRYELPSDRKSKNAAKPQQPRKPSMFAEERGNAHAVVLQINEAAGFLDLFVSSVVHAHM